MQAYEVSEQKNRNDASIGEFKPTAIALRLKINSKIRHFIAQYYKIGNTNSVENLKLEVDRSIK